jgi:RNA polymerase sigma-70 factor (ECF subfamily)
MDLVVKQKKLEQRYGAFGMGPSSMESSSSEVTTLLAGLSNGDRSVIGRLMPLVYDELHHRAASYMHGERMGHTLQPTALVHETYLKLVEQRAANFKDRIHFMAVAANVMRRILIDHARAYLSVKRGGEQIMVPLDEATQFRSDTPSGLMAVDDALQRLEVIDARQEQIVEMRFFGGLTVEEIAKALDISTRTVEREWAMARAWLYVQLKNSGVEE